MNRIGIWGDSITWGSADHELGGWVTRLRHFIDNQYKDGPAVYNVGVSGDKVADVLKRFDIEYNARKPEAVILAVGINDSPHDSHPDGTPMDVFEQQFAELVLKAKTAAQKLVIVGPTNVDDSHPEHHGYSDLAIKPYAATIQKIASQNQLPYVDLWGLITKDDLKLDGLHPEAAGHEKIFQKIKTILTEELGL